MTLAENILEKLIKLYWNTIQIDWHHWMNIQKMKFCSIKSMKALILLLNLNCGLITCLLVIILKLLQTVFMIPMWLCLLYYSRVMIVNWLSIGLKMGFTMHKVNENTNGLSLCADKLKALFEAKVQEVERDEAAKQLLTACYSISQSIIAAVKDQLAVSDVAAAAAAHPKFTSAEMKQVADCKLNKFTPSTVSVIEQQNKFSLFSQAHQMLDDWTNDLDGEAKVV
ncbi:uncharacterized protein LOC134184500 isoform X2 [Corticium candelabrum]|uniref:uncharacterized protein LOC134184500 isoform X2 n=1 Tax=Corticium candelabrum TaxID=121492 RepID=UPI002E307E23|nr:uncharacterized protein LOC134184500 isoform X2 [Corticium candelabrum]